MICNTKAHEIKRSAFLLSQSDPITRTIKTLASQNYLYYLIVLYKCQSGYHSDINFCYIRSILNIGFIRNGIRKRAGSSFNRLLV
jgi:hypothetical protein